MKTQQIENTVTIPLVLSTEGVHAPDANVVGISKIAGYKDLRTTLGYVHTSTQRLHDTVAKLPNVSNS